MKNNSYEASGESPIVLCAYGKTPGKAMKEMGKLVDRYIKKDESVLILGMNSSYDEDGFFCMNVTISSWL
jgi:hypothetical protein